MIGTARNQLMTKFFQKTQFRLRPLGRTKLQGLPCISWRVSGRSSVTKRCSVSESSSFIEKPSVGRPPLELGKRTRNLFTGVQRRRREPFDQLFRLSNVSP